MKRGNEVLLQKPIFTVNAIKKKKRGSISETYRFNERYDAECKFYELAQDKSYKAVTADFSIDKPRRPREPESLSLWV